MKYLGVQREKSRKYSQSWQHQHAADELKTIAAAVNYLSEHGISNLDELDASLSSVSDEAFSIREGMKAAEQRIHEVFEHVPLQKQENNTHDDPRHDETVRDHIPLQIRECSGEQQARQQNVFKGLERNIIF